MGEILEILLASIYSYSIRQQSDSAGGLTAVFEKKHKNRFKKHGKYRSLS